MDEVCASDAYDADVPPAPAPAPAPEAGGVAPGVAAGVVAGGIACAVQVKLCVPLPVLPVPPVPLVLCEHMTTCLLATSINHAAPPVAVLVVPPLPALPDVPTNGMYGREDVLPVEGAGVCAIATAEGIAMAAIKRGSDFICCSYKKGLVKAG